ncbi:MAG: acyl-CoA thioesterase [Reichenbachiella sp.]|uniref:acyl-CoA thioesterase n=1 Tax=Reichenbachiella sp. TaxID=2184521 RepID=UPI003263C9A6
MKQFVEDSVEVRVRFSESDAMGVIWHGNYLKFFEDGREKLGEHFGMSYLDISKAGYVVPIVNVEVKYLAPVTFGQKIKVICHLVDAKAAKIIHEYEIWNLATNQISCKGRTEQVFLNQDTKSLQLNYPEFYEKWKKNLPWKQK